MVEMVEYDEFMYNFKFSLWNWRVNLEVLVSQGKSESGKANIERVAAKDSYVANNPRILGCSNTSVSFSNLVCHL